MTSGLVRGAGLRLPPARLAMILALSVLLVLGVASAFPVTAAASPSAAWSLRGSAPQPAHFSSTHNAQCDLPSGGFHCDSYTLLVTNVGSQAASGAVVIADTLPASAVIREIRGEDLSDNASFACT